MTCNKKLGLLGFTCRCGGQFCPSHRHSDTHDCDYDYKKEAMKQLSSTLTKVSGSKLEKL
jgi:predicted nucleic acid binding AN1-type Zn finger protein